MTRENRVQKAEKNRCHQCDPWERGWGGGGQENGIWGLLDKPGWSRGCCRERSRKKEGFSVLPALGGF